MQVPADKNRRPRGGTVVFLLFLLFLIAVWALLAFSLNPIFPIDDAYICFRYAQNWANGLGLVFNEGERVEAFSNFLWTLLLAAARALGFSEAPAARLFGWFSVAGSCAVLALLTRRRWGRRRFLLSLAAGLAFALLPATVFHALSGMETPLTCLLLLTTALAFDREKGTRANSIGIGLVLALLSLNRPEGMALSALVLFFVLAVKFLDLPIDIPRFPWLILSYLSVVVPFLAWRFLYYGSFVPNSLTAKSGGINLLILKGGAEYLLQFVTFSSPILLLAAVSLVRAQSRDVLLFRIPVVTTYVLTVLLGGAADGYPYSRYLFPLVPLLILWSIEGGALVLDVAGPSLAGFGRRIYPAFLVCVVVALQLALVIQQHRLVGLVYGAPGGNTRTKPAAFLAPDRSPHEAQGSLEPHLGHHRLASWLSKHARKSDLLATYEIGIVPYYTGLRVLDLYGLASREIAVREGLPGLKADADTVFRRKPSYIVLRVPSDCLCSHYPSYQDSRLRDDYELAALFPYLNSDILLFKRRDSPLYSVVLDLDSEDGALARLPKVQLVGPLEKERLHHTIRSSFPDQAAEPRLGADAMRRWLHTWRRVVASPQTEGAVDGRLRCRLQIPAGARLEFGIFAKRLPGARALRSGAGSSIEVRIETGNAEPQLLFRRQFSLQEEWTKGWEDVTVDMQTWAGQLATITFQASSEQLPLVVGFGDPRVVVPSRLID